MGYDGNAVGSGKSIVSSGGYVQKEWAFSDRLIGVLRVLVDPVLLADRLS
ncbi:MAG: hypothetical protein ABI182_03515 [Candidatus Baltobacteraceae bacterium]